MVFFDWCLLFDICSTVAGYPMYGQSKMPYNAVRNQQYNNAHPYGNIGNGADQLLLNNEEHQVVAHSYVHIYSLFQIRRNTAPSFANINFGPFTQAAAAEQLKEENVSCCHYCLLIIIYFS